MSFLVTTVLALGASASAQTLRPLIELPPTVYGFEPTHRSDVGRHATSADGRYVVFTSLADNLDAGGGGQQVYLLERDNGALRMLSRALDGRRGNAGSFSPAISADGTHVAFVSDASNLVAGDTPGTREVVVERLADGMRRRFAVPQDSADPTLRPPFRPIPSADGSRVVFAALGAGEIDAIYVGEMSSGLVQRVTAAEVGGQRVVRIYAFDFAVAVGAIAYAAHGVGSQTSEVLWQPLDGSAPELLSVDASGQPVSAFSREVAASRSGHRVAFATGAALVGDDTNGQVDVYLRDRSAATTRLASRLPGGVLPNEALRSFALASDGRWLAFSSNATNTDGGGFGVMYLRDLDEPSTLRLGRLDASEGFTLSSGGERLIFGSFREDLVVGDRNRQSDVFARELPFGAVTRLSLASAGPFPTVPCCITHVAASSNGAWLSVSGARLDPVAETRHAFLVLDTLPQALIGPIGLSTFSGVEYIADDGARLDWLSTYFGTIPIGPPFPMPPLQDIFVAERATGIELPVAVRPDGGLPDGDSYGSQLSANGRYVAFVSQATDVLPGSDPQGMPQVYRRDLETGALALVSATPGGAGGGAPSGPVAISRDGRWVVFATGANDLIAGDPEPGILLWDAASGTLERIVDLPAYPEGLAKVAVCDGARRVVWDFGSLTTQVYVHDRATGITRLASQATDGSPANRSASRPVLSADCSALAFVSEATNLGVTTGRFQVYARATTGGDVVPVSVDDAGIAGNGHSLTVALRDDGRAAYFLSESSNWSGDGRSPNPNAYEKRLDLDAIFRDGFED